MLKLYGMSGKLIYGMKAFYIDANACTKVKGEISESSKYMGVSQKDVSCLSP